MLSYWMCPAVRNTWVDPKPNGKPIEAAFCGVMAGGINKLGDTSQYPCEWIDAVTFTFMIQNFTLTNNFHIDSEDGLTRIRLDPLTMRQPLNG